MRNIARRLTVATLVPIIALSACSSPGKPEAETPTTEAASPSPTAKEPKKSSTPEKLKKQLPEVENVRVSDVGDHLEVSFKSSEGGESHGQKATLDIVQAVAKYTGDYEYVLIAGIEPDSKWSYSYNKSTVKEIAASDDPVVSRIWDLADRAVDPR